MRTYKSESELVASLKNKFLKYSDFTIVQEERIRLKDITMILDIVIKYGGKHLIVYPFLIICQKRKKTLDNQTLFWYNLKKGGKLWKTNMDF